MYIHGEANEAGSEYQAMLQERDLHRLAAELVAGSLDVDLDDPAVTYRCWFEDRPGGGSERVARVRLTITRQTAKA